MRKNLTRAGVAAMITGAAMAGAVSTAGAVGASGTVKNQTTVAISCANGYNGNALIRRALPTGTTKQHPGKWFVAHVVGGPKDAKTLTATKIDVTFTFTDSKNNVTTNTENITKKAKAGKQTTCTLAGTKSVDSGTLQVSGTVTGAFH